MYLELFIRLSYNFWETNLDKDYATNPDFNSINTQTVKAEG